MRVDASMIVNVVERMIEDKLAKHTPSLRLGTVISLEGNTISVTLDGTTYPVPAIRACSCETGSRVVLLRQDTQIYCIAKVGE